MNPLEDEYLKFRIIKFISPLVPFFYFALMLCIPCGWLPSYRASLAPLKFGGLGASILILALPRMLERRYLPRRGSGEAADLKTLLKFLFVMLIAGESIAVFGLILYFIGFPRTDFFVFFFIAVLFFADFRILRFDKYRDAFEGKDSPN